MSLERWRTATVWVAAALLGAACGGDTDRGITTAPAPSVPTTGAAASSSTTVAAMGSEIVLHGGVVITMDAIQPRAEAVLTRGDRIVLVGSDTEVLSAAGSDALLIDLEGRTVLPGFIDAHTHRISGYSAFGYPTASDAVTDALAQGWTSVDELNVPEWELDAFLALDAEGPLRLRINLYLAATGFFGEPLGDWYSAYAPDQQLGSLLRVAGIKVFPDSDNGRVLHFTQEELDDLVGSLHEEGWQVAMKAISPQAHEQVLDTIETVLRGGPNTGRHRIEHALTMTSDQVLRMAEMGVVASIQPHYPGALVDDPGIQSLIAEHGQSQIGRWRDLVEAGVPIASGYAFPNGYDQGVFDGVPPPGSPLRLLYRASTQTRDAATPPPGWMLAHALTVEETLRSLTIDAAFANRTEDRLGSITPGKLADLIVLSGDPLAASVEELGRIEVLVTLVGGVAEWCSPPFADLCAAPSEPAPANGVSEWDALASAALPGQPPTAAIDGDHETVWTAGDHPVHWIEIDLGSDVDVIEVRLVVSQHPEGLTRHVIYGRSSDGAEVELWVVSGDTSDGQVLTVRPDSPWSALRYLRIETTISPSWVAWREVEIDHS